MEISAFYVTKLQHFCSSASFLFKYVYRYLIVVANANPLWVQLSYFISFSFLGFLVLNSMTPRTAVSYTPRNLDMFFTAVSATTVSSMSTVEMEVFSNSQLLILTLLMFIGGEVFTSMLGLLFRKSNLKKKEQKVASIDTSSDAGTELQEISIKIDLNNYQEDAEKLKYCSIKFLCYVVLGYLLVVHVMGVTVISLYLAVIASAKQVLEAKGLKTMTFSVFTTVSTFASCGFVPTNENMIVFSKNSGLLLMIIPQVLLGNTLFPSCLRFCVWVLGKFVKRRESEYLLNKTGRVGYLHWLSPRHSRLLVVTVVSFIAVQVVLMCSMDWNSDALKGLNGYQKFVGVVFQSVNSRHTGETIVDITAISRAVLVLFVVMMYLPPYTSFLPIKGDEDDELQSQMCVKKSKKSRRRFVENVIMSQLSYLAIFVILICITERQKMKQDPLNFNVLNIVVEVISAYGNVGFTTGYSCAKQLNPDGQCVDKWFGFSGKWSDQGKIILIVVMFFGRLKKFNMNGGRAWILM